MAGLESWLDAKSKIVHYVVFLLLFLIATSISTWGMYFTLKFPNMTTVEAFKKAIPFAWVDWLFQSAAVYVGDRYKLVTPTQDTLLLIIVQFTVVLIMNNFYLKQKVTRSDIACFFIILLGFYISFSHAVSKMLGKPVPVAKKPSKTGKKARAATKAKKPAEHSANEKQS